MNNLIKSSIEYYDLKESDFRSIKYDILYENKSDLNYNNIIIDSISNNKKKFNYEILCKIDKNNKMIIWSWALPNIEKNKTFISRNLLKYGLDLNDDSLIELKNILINSKIRYQNVNSMNILFYIFFFLTKKDWIFALDNYLYIIFDSN
jgi:hypothetical protein